jgi:hypothetical protein
LGEANLHDLVVISDYIKGIKKFGVEKDLETNLDDMESRAASYLKESIVFSGYSSTGTHIIAISQPTTLRNGIYEDIINQIRSDDKEFRLLRDIMLETDRGHLDVADIMRWIYTLRI